MDEILMRHPVLGVERAFPASAAPMHTASGWVVVEDADPAEPVPTQPAGMSAEEAMRLGQSLPAASAPKAEWVAAAEAAKVPAEEIEGKTKPELIARLTGQDTTDTAETQE